MTTSGNPRLFLFQESRRRECLYIHVRLLSLHELAHQQGADRRQQDSVSEVASGYEGSGQAAGSHYGKVIGRAGTQAGPGFQNSSFADAWNQIGRGLVQALDCCRLNSLVETNVLNGCANQYSTVGSGDEINFARSDYVSQTTFRRNYREHLPLARTSRNSRSENFAGPCSTTVHKIGSRVRRPLGA